MLLDFDAFLGIFLVECFLQTKIFLFDGKLHRLVVLKLSQLLLSLQGKQFALYFIFHHPTFLILFQAFKLHLRELRQVIKLLLCKVVGHLLALLRIFGDDRVFQLLVVPDFIQLGFLLVVELLHLQVESPLGITFRIDLVLQQLIGLSGAEIDESFFPRFFVGCKQLCKGLSFCGCHII